MLTKRPSNERGHADHGWLKTYHTFSFADYYDPKHTHFRTLRVINEDTVAPEGGFGMHPHRDMEIITYILSGAIEHEDSMGNKGIIRPGDVQRMTAGTGVVHSEFNPSKSEPVHLLQIWLYPEKHGLTPSYEQRTFHDQDKRNTFCRIASHDGHNDSVQINQDATVYASIVSDGAELKHHFISGRAGFLQVARGTVHIDDIVLHHGDAVAIEDEDSILIRASQNGEAEFLLFDLA
ncbi:MAG: pirin family protein [Bacteroidota bacterium]|nr:pirin family protein [Bacteroidota bacterium]MDP4232288.1 pirin family protein [Bacteroidota bacterium]MDP4241427.1 pirin family protein [Bacteroidota bacterium]MDP4286749.1 pirin family protein [Bacteroidota bacterium]